MTYAVGLHERVGPADRRLPRLLERADAGHGRDADGLVREVRVRAAVHAADGVEREVEVEVAGVDGQLDLLALEAGRVTGLGLLRALGPVHVVGVQPLVLLLLVLGEPLPVGLLRGRELAPLLTDHLAQVRLARPLRLGRARRARSEERGLGLLHLAHALVDAVAPEQNEGVLGPLDVARVAALGPRYIRILRGRRRRPPPLGRRRLKRETRRGRARARGVARARAAGDGRLRGREDRRRVRAR
jgi:hypothetical protein